MENSEEVVSIGNLAFWAPGNTFYVFSGPMPVRERKFAQPALLRYSLKTSAMPICSEMVSYGSLIVIKKESTG
jgi:hypothetical protein